jgi:hypothetical protein
MNLVGRFAVTLLSTYLQCQPILWVLKNERTSVVALDFRLSK